MKLVLNYKWYDKEQKKNCSTTYTYRNIWKFQINKRSINYWVVGKDCMLHTFISEYPLEKKIEILEDDDDGNSN